VFFPSLLTFFNVVASLENGARARSGQGLILWFTKLPWHEPSLVAQAPAMVLVTFGGISGLINASCNMNLVVHNTAWVPGHFHLTVGTAVTLTFMGISYWLVPYLCSRALWNRPLALVQAWLWFIGMIIFSQVVKWPHAASPITTPVAIWLPPGTRPKRLTWLSHGQELLRLSRDPGRFASTSLKEKSKVPLRFWV
jgi:cytochrome c oxidase subunit I